MKLELKNIHFYERMSEETNCFDAFLYADGKKIAHVRNDGRGGSHSINSTSQDYAAFRKVEEYCKALPGTPYDYGENNKGIHASDIESVVDDLLTAYLKDKDDKKIQKICLTGIVWGNEKGYSSIRWPYTIAELIASEKGIQALINTYHKTILPMMRETETILNKNIPDDILARITAPIDPTNVN